VLVQVTVLGLVLVGFVSMAAAQTAQLALTPQDSSVDCGGLVTVNVTIADVTDLQGFSLYLQYDPSVVTIDNTVAGDDLVQECPLIAPVFEPYTPSGGILRVDAALLGCTMDATAPKTIVSISFAPGAIKSTSALTITGTTLLRDSGNQPIGYEVTGGSIANICNTAPVVQGDTFTIAENSASGMPVGDVIASDIDIDDTLSFAITAGNDAGRFAIDSATGEVDCRRLGSPGLRNDTFVRAHGDCYGR